MNNKRVWKVMGSIGIAAILAVIAAGRIYTVNARYPQREEKEIASGDFFELKKGVEMRIVDSRWLSSTEVQDEYDDVWYVDNPDDYKAVEVKVKVRNRTDKKKKVPLFKIYIESDQYDWNGSDAEMFAYLRSKNRFCGSYSGALFSHRFFNSSA